MPLGGLTKAAWRFQPRHHDVQGKRCLNSLLRSQSTQVVFGAFLIQFTVIGCMFAYGVFFPALEAEFGWSRTFLSAVSSLAFLVMGTGAIFAGRVNDRFGPRGVLTLTGLVSGCGLALMSGMSEPWHLLVLFGLFVGIGLSTHDVVTLSTIAAWFPRRRGLMSGVVKSGTAVGQVVIPMTASALILAVGWRDAFLALGLMAIGLLVFAATRMRPAPSAGVQADTSTHGAIAGLPFEQIKRLPQFWTFCAIQFTFFPALMTVPVHIVVHGQDLGLTPAAAAGVLSTLGGISVLGRLLLGPAVDKLGGRVCLIICFALLFASLLWLRVATSASELYLFAVVYGLAHGGFFTVVSPTLAEYFGLRAHGLTFGFVLFSGTIGGALGPLLAGRVFDSTGSYLMAFNTLIGLALIGLLLAVSLRTPRRQAETHGEASAAPAGQKL